jgi:hypothetical protein
MSFKRLNVFATTEQIARVKDAQNKPLMAITNPAPPGPGVPHAISMFLSPLEVAHAIALEQGLPAFEGFYGIDLSNGEFIKAD